MRYAALIGRRLWQLVPIVIFATFVVFSLLQLVPGDPALTLAGDYASKERIEEIRKLYGFDQPLVVQYGVWLWHAVRGDLGISLLSSAPVLDLILQRMPNTILIAVYALLIAASIGISLGVLAATRVGTRRRHLRNQRGIARRGAAELLARHPAGRDAVARPAPVPGHRRAAVHGEPGRRDQARHPAGHRARGRRDRGAGAPGAQRPHRGAGLAVCAHAAAKGLGPTAILWKHGLRNITVTLLTLVGLQVNRLFSGAVVIEAVFAIPGAGNLVAYSALNKDFPVVQGMVLVFVVIVILINLAVDVLSALLDPRVAEA